MRRHVSIFATAAVLAGLLAVGAGPAASSHVISITFSGALDDDLAPPVLAAGTPITATLTYDSTAAGAGTEGVAQRYQPVDWRFQIGAFETAGTSNAILEVSAADGRLHILTTDPSVGPLGSIGPLPVTQFDMVLGCRGPAVCDPNPFPVTTLPLSIPPVSQLEVAQFDLGIDFGAGGIVTGTATLSAIDAPVTHPTVVRPFGVLVSPEGSAGSTTYQLPVFLSEPATAPVSVRYETVDGLTHVGLAQDGADFASTSGTLTFAVGETVRHVPIDMLGDTLDEAPLLWGEWGMVRFFDVTGPAELDTSSFFGLGLFIIVDDD